MWDVEEDVVSASVERVNYKAVARGQVFQESWIYIHIHTHIHTYRERERERESARESERERLRERD
jgi:hypothetical protein